MLFPQRRSPAQELANGAAWKKASWFHSSAASSLKRGSRNESKSGVADERAFRLQVAGSTDSS